MRQELIDDIEKAKKTLTRYDEFFDKLESGKTIYEQLVYDDSPVIVESWDREKGLVTVSYEYMGKKRTDTNPYWRYSHELRNNLVF